ncbi:post-COAP-1 domain-containing protein [Chloroflexota bacterium]
MRHKRFGISFMLASLAVLLSISLACSSVVAAMTFSQITQPDANYIVSTAKVEILDLTDNASYASITDGTLAVGFNQDMEKRTVPDNWETWSSPPFSEADEPHVLYTGGSGVTSLTMILSEPCTTFGFELEPDPFSYEDYDAYFILTDGDILIGTISMTVNGDSGARLFAGEVEGGTFDKIVISGTSEFAIAQVRYDLLDLLLAGSVTGGGQINIDDDKKAEFTFGGNATCDSQGGLIGQFQTVDHENKVSYHFNSVTSLNFSGEATKSPDSPYNAATFEINGRDNEGNPVSITVTIEDIQEPGRGFDTVNVTGDINFIGTLDGGNFQIHPDLPPENGTSYGVVKGGNKWSADGTHPVKLSIESGKIKFTKPKKK